MKKKTLTITAHVDAGKTTLSECLLYKTGTIRKIGRVDHEDAFLDYDDMEKSRGITIFSKQAVFKTKNTEFTLIDTPGHTDFSSETERVFNITDYAILVLNATDPVQSHTRTLWELLKVYKIPVFIFVNKTDLSFDDSNEIINKIKYELNDNFVDFTNTNSDEFKEELAVCDDNFFEKYDNEEGFTEDDIKSAVAQRKVFPVYFGSALKLKGIDEFIEGIDKYTKEINYGSDFSAEIFKIKRDKENKRLSFLKVTGGKLKVKDLICHGEAKEKVNQIRIYSGDRYTTTDIANAGTVCAVTGLDSSFSGEIIGNQAENAISPLLHPVMTYKIILPEDKNINDAMSNFKIIEEEDPQVNFSYNEQTREINVKVMGEIQLQILKNIVHDRFGFDIEFGDGKIVYKETISNKVIGSGHFEPLRHYAEVHFQLEPCDCDGIEYSSKCSTDVLAENWQNLIKTHVFEKRHKGVLTRSDITGIKVTLIAGKANIKHTSGGDFRQAVYRAVRNGLMKADNVLLEPYFYFILKLPENFVGRAMTDIKQMFGEFSQPEIQNGFAVLKGEAPVSTIQNYANNINAYTNGTGSISFSFSGYKPCHNQEEVVENIGYDPESDISNSADSIFCQHGAATLVKWDEAENYMHIDVTEKNKNSSDPSPRINVGNDEIEAILKREFYVYDNKKMQAQSQAVTHGSFDTLDNYVYKGKESLKEYLLVDGYNIIYAWQELKKIADHDYNSARKALIDIMSNYQAYRKCTIVVVFDAYKVSGNPGSKRKYNNIYIVYTKEAETADMYIEKTTKDIGHKYRVRVATSDSLEQMIILGRGALRISAAEFEKEVKNVNSQIHLDMEQKNSHQKNYLGNYMPKELKNHK